MKRYATFSLYWESWGGYSSRDHPFGMPRLVRVLASRTGGTVTLVGRRSSGPDVREVASTSDLSFDLVASLPELVAAAVAAPGPLVSDPGDGVYQVVEEISGFGDEPFHLTFSYTTPTSVVWAPAAKELMDALHDIQQAAGS